MHNYNPKTFFQIVLKKITFFTVERRIGLSPAVAPSGGFIFNSLHVY